MSSNLPSEMKALRLLEFNENYKLCEDVPVPVPCSKEILVQLVASGFCHTDHMVYEGAFKTKLPHTGSHEPTGTIAALGPDVSGEWKVGDRVGVYLFTNPCGSCSGCKWYSATFGQKPKARYCDNRTMCGIVGTDGGFAEYMLAHDEAVVKIPEEVSFEQAAPMMCAGATVWNGILEANLQKGQTLAIVGIGALGLLGIQFAKALGYRVVAVRNRDLTQIQEAEVSPALRPDLTVNPKDETSIQQILDFTDGIGLHPAVVCNDKGGRQVDRSLLNGKSRTLGEFGPELCGRRSYQLDAASAGSMETSPRHHDIRAPQFSAYLIPAVYAVSDWVAAAKRNS